MKSRLVHGVGISDGDSPTQKKDKFWIDGKCFERVVWTCPFYSRWCAMLNRVYGVKANSENSNYKNCSVCEEWKRFSNFKAWMEKQDWEGKHLDKDLLKFGNRAYCSEFCTFVDTKVNAFLTDSLKVRGEWPIGVDWHKISGRFRARIGNPFTTKSECLGYYSSPEPAHQAWLTRKLELAKLLAAEQDDPRVAKALVLRYENYGEYYET